MGAIISLAVLDASAATATVLIDAALAGGETFTACRVPGFNAGPGFGNEIVALTATSPTTEPQGEQYTLTWPEPVLNLGTGDLWYVRTEASGEATRTPMFIWMLPVVPNNEYLLETALAGQAIADILMANADAISFILQAVDPSLTFHAAVYGAEWNASRQTPGVLIKPLTVDEQYENMPRGLLPILRYSISAIIRAGDAANEAAAIGQLRDVISRVMNQSCYETYLLPNGAIVNGGMATGWQFADDFLAETTWINRADTTWKWEFIRYTG